MEVIQVPLRKDVFEKLQRLAEPLVDDPSSVIERLVNHWESSPRRSEARASSVSTAKQKYWSSARGERFPLGAKLRAKYLGQSFEAEVTSHGIEFNGETYENPSSAGIAAKESVGTTGKAANTNGWEFWEMFEPITQSWFSIDKLRKESLA